MSSDDADGDGEFDKEILKYVGKKIGIKLTKAESVSTSLVLKKNDTELIQAAKIMTTLRRQTAIFNKSPTKEMNSPSKSKRSLLMNNSADKQVMQVLQNLTERNYSMQLQLIDCSLGPQETAHHATAIWN